MVLSRSAVSRRSRSLLVARHRPMPANEGSSFLRSCSEISTVPCPQVHGSDLLIRPKQCCSLKPASLSAKAVVPTMDSEPSDPILLGTEVRMAYRPKSVQRLSVRARARSPTLLITVLGVPAARGGSAALPEYWPTGMLR